MYSTVNRIFHFSYFDADYLTSRLTVTGLARVYCTRLPRIFVADVNCAHGSFNRVDGSIVVDILGTRAASMFMEEAYVPLKHS
jgi:hypothetical protein